MTTDELASLAELLFPDVTKTPEDIARRYPSRRLPEGAKVTRLAPSPTGYLHFGALFPALIGERLAHLSGGVFYLRVEDTDARREVPGAAAALVRTLAHYGISFDEGATLDGEERGDYGPYRQRARASIYRVFAKELTRRGLAYPCFADSEEVESLQSADKKEELLTRDWTGAEEKRRALQEKWRAITLKEAREALAEGKPFVLRLQSAAANALSPCKPATEPGSSPENQEPRGSSPDAAAPGGEATQANPAPVIVTDLVKGKLTLPANEEDFVLLKSDGIPTYHFAHAVDDHLMGTTHVVRGEEWLPSLPKHLQIFRALGFRAPKYLHIAQILRLDEGGGKKKLSKRDRGANLDDYERMGYPAAAVIEYVMTLLNSNYEDWRRANPALPYTDFPFSVKKMGSAGCLFDFEKLNDVSKNVLAGMSTDEVTSAVQLWARDFAPDFAERLARDPAKARAIFAIGRGGKKPRKDYATFAEAQAFVSFFYDETFVREDDIPPAFPRESVREVLRDFLAHYDHAADATAWFEGVKATAARCGYCPEMKLYKEDPTPYRGSVADVSGFLRIAVTGRANSPDLYTVMQILGEQTTRRRISEYADEL